RNRAAVLLGPSTPICPEAFEGSRITQLSGSMVSEPERVKQIISQGGGTMLMKKNLQFVNIGV
ncbi:MAG: Rossmann-like domain-containing protein, partial [Desulfopila sp.]